MLSRRSKVNKFTKKMININRFFLKNVVESFPQYVFWKNLNSVYLGCNKNYAHLVGLNSPEEIIGKTDDGLAWEPIGDISDIFKKGDSDTFSEHMINNREELIRFPNGKTLISLVSKLPIVNEGKIIGIAVYFSDIAELKEKEKELIKLKKETEAANEAKSAFIMNISHDIRTPLAGMIGMTRILSKELQTKQEKEAAVNLLKAENILLDLLNSFIEVAKLGRNGFPLYEVKFDMKELVNDLLALFTPSVQEKCLGLVLQYDDAIPKYLIGDQTRIHRIFLNLISNSIKFTPAGGSIEVIISLAKQKDRNIILKGVVKDTGIGISVENQQVIFSKFTRIEPAYKGNHKGSGLGLSIVKQFISEIEGEIHVDSEPGVGSTFTCLIPLKEALLDEPQKKAALKVDFDFTHELSTITNQTSDDLLKSISKPEIQSTDLLKVKILLVEDNKIAQIGAKKLLEDMNCEVVVADTAEIALELFNENKYDLIFMDLGLPGKNGYVATHEMRELEKSKQKYTPIIALTAQLDLESKQQCLVSGVQEVLTKPLQYEMVSRVLEIFFMNRGRVVK